MFSLQSSTWSSSTSLSSCLCGLTGRPSSPSLPTPPKRYNNPDSPKQAPLCLRVCNPLSKSVSWMHFLKKQIYLLLFFSSAPVLPAQGWEGALWEGGEARVPAGDPVESCNQPASVHPHGSRRYVCPNVNENEFCLSAPPRRSRPLTRYCCVGMTQRSVTATAVKLSSQTGVITAPRATCKNTLFTEH